MKVNVIESRLLIESDKTNNLYNLKKEKRKRKEKEKEKNRRRERRREGTR